MDSFESLLPRVEKSYVPTHKQTRKASKELPEVEGIREQPYVREL